MKLSYLIAALFLIQHVNAQIAVSAGDAQSGSQAPAPTTSAAPSVDSSSSAAPQPSTTENQPTPTSNAATNPSTTAAPVNPPTPSSSNSSTNDSSNNDNNSSSNNSKNNNNNNNNSNNNSGSSSTDANKNKATDTPNADGTNDGNNASKTASDSSSSSSVSNDNEKSDGDNGSNDDSKRAGLIAGSVVGGLVGLALIAGILTWVNRHGGCTSPSRRRTKEELPAQPEDFAVDMHEAPSPFQHARRFVPPTSSGYMTLQDQQDYAYNNASVEALHRHEQPTMDYQYYAPAYDPAHSAVPTAPAPVAGIWPSPHEQHAGIKPDTIEHKPNAA